MAEAPLAGCGVAVTRAAHQADEVCRALDAAGATTLKFPTLAIEPLAPVPPPVGDFDWIVYTSSNAVEHAGPLRARRGRVAAIGPATAAALTAHGISASIVAPGDGSESLLAALAASAHLTGCGPGLAAGQRLLLVTGRDGRALLPRTLGERGVVVHTAEVYARTRPASDPKPLRDALRRGALHAITITSNAALSNLHALLGPQARMLLDEVQLVVASERAVKLARELGIVRAPLVASDASAPALVAALAAWWPNALRRTDHGR